jgi:ATP-binding cassette subfamily B (MDR/TAP) protein 7
LRTIYDSDLIIVLKGGSVAEQGTHETLVDSDGIYSELWSAQEMLFTEEEMAQQEKDRDARRV